jgi:hypothetical protein
MKARSICLSLAILLAVSGSGCTLLDRESYSLMIRKPAHKYELPEPPPAAPPEPDEPVYVSVSQFSRADSPPWVRRDLDALIEGAAPSLDAFRPFTYCYLHKSSHTLESAVAVVVAPVEYPLAVVTTVCSYEKQIGFFYVPGEPVMSAVIITTAILWGVLKSLFGPAAPIPDPYSPPSR